MRVSLIRAASGLIAGTIVLTAPAALAIPSNFGSPFNPPRGMFVAIGGVQVQSDRSWDMSLGGAYGLTGYLSPTYSVERTSTGYYVAELGAGSAWDIAGLYARLGVSASDVVNAKMGPSYSLAVDWGRPLGLGLVTYGEISGGLSPTGGPGPALSPGFNYSQALELAITPQVSVDLEYLGGLSQQGRSEMLCTDVSATLGDTFLTGTVMLPRAPQAGPPIYLVSTAFELYP